MGHNSNRNFILINWHYGHLTVISESKELVHLVQFLTFLKYIEISLEYISMRKPFPLQSYKSLTADVTVTLPVFSLCKTPFIQYVSVNLMGV